MTEDEVRELLRREVERAGGPAAWSRANGGVSLVYIGDVIAGRRAPGPRILEALHLEKVPPTYRRIPQKR